MYKGDSMRLRKTIVILLALFVVMFSIPSLPATTLTKECYAAMFSGCTKLTSLRVHFNAWTPADATSGWVKDVSATGKFYYKSSLDVSVKDDDHVPANFAPEIF